MAAKMRETLRKQEVTFEPAFRSRRITDEMVEQADLVLYMSVVHKKKLLERWPQHAAKFKAASPWGDVLDPHFETGLSAHRAVVEELKRACAWWAPKMGVL
jgi:protein-tyrosine-phosphatase